MTNVSILPDKLKDFSYYQNKLPLYLQNSYGFLEHFKIWFDFLTGQETEDSSSIVLVIDRLFELLNIFDLNCVSDHNISYNSNEHYLQFLNSIPDSEEGTASDILDKLGNLFGLRRQFSVVVDGNTKLLNLDNRDFLLLIKCTIVKNYFDGTFAELNRYYNEVGLPVFVITSTTPATCLLYLINIEESLYTPSQNVIDMFLAGMLTVESMGIEYTYEIESILNLAIFDSVGVQNVFDAGVFVA